MAEFSMRFFACNLLVAVMIGIILAARRLFQQSLSARMQYHLWFFLLALLAVPFLRLRPAWAANPPGWLSSLGAAAAAPGASTPVLPAAGYRHAAGWMNDFSISVSRSAPPAVTRLLPVLWLAGILVMLASVIRSQYRLYRLQQSALPLENEAVRKLYQNCRREMKLAKDLPVYTTAYLNSPVMAGLFSPRIYLPLHLITDYHPRGIRYMLLHELQHYRHRDTLVNYLMNLAAIVYWFNPLVWCALKEMRSDREVACDTSVLTLLREEDYEDYGHTLIDFAGTISSHVPFAAGIGGSMALMKRRVLNIARYKPPSRAQRCRSLSAFGATAALLLGLAPALSAGAAGTDYFHWKKADLTVIRTDYSRYFTGYEGSFVLYDSADSSWTIYNEEQAVRRVSPASTYKIYSAVLGLESGVITPENSRMEWSGEIYPIAGWNQDHDLKSALSNSANWYFQQLDAQAGPAAVARHLRTIGYGNQDISGDDSSFWLESSLKISALEQVELLQKLDANEWHFAPAAIGAVKDALRLPSAPAVTLYGKTGTGQVNGHNVNGWFVGYLETPGRTCYFAANIQAEEDASGSAAAKITREILSDLQLLP